MPTVATEFEFLQQSFKRLGVCILVHIRNHKLCRASPQHTAQVVASAAGNLSTQNADGPLLKAALVSTDVLKTGAGTLRALYERSLLREPSRPFTHKRTPVRKARLGSSREAVPLTSFPWWRFITLVIQRRCVPVKTLPRILINITEQM